MHIKFAYLFSITDNLLSPIRVFNLYKSKLENNNKYREVSACFNTKSSHTIHLNIKILLQYNVKDIASVLC